MRKRNRNTGGVAIGPGMDSFDAMAQLILNQRPVSKSAWRRLLARRLREEYDRGREDVAAGIRGLLGVTP